jgi:competence protein CoiA
MKLALVNMQRHEPLPGLMGTCPACAQTTIAKCGEIKEWHWAHKGKRHCDPWWENETPWHRAWKGKFPIHWQEIVHEAITGEKHIADVKTETGWVIEFQHSHLKPQERRSRDHFYTKLTWVVDGTRRKRDLQQLQDAWKYGIPTGPNSKVMRVSIERCALLKEWVETSSPVLFDLGQSELIWWKIASSQPSAAYLFPYSRELFVELHRGTDPEASRKFEEFVLNIPNLIESYEKPAPKPEPMPHPNQASHGALPRPIQMVQRRRRL